MQRRVCPNCKRVYDSGETTCFDCGTLLAGVNSDFEKVLSYMDEPRLLASSLNEDFFYLCEALAQAKIPYYTEERMELNYRYGGVKGGSVEPVAVMNLYVDRADWEEAERALTRARDEAEKETAIPARYPDMPKDWEDEVENGDGDQSGKEPAEPVWYLDSNIFWKTLIGMAAAFALIGVLIGIFS